MAGSRRRDLLIALAFVALALAPRCYLKADSSRILAAKHVVVEIGFVGDAAPEAMSIQKGFPIVRRHLERLFRRGDPDIEFLGPTAITDAPASVWGETFSMDDAVSLATRERTVQNTGDTAAFYVLFLPGVFSGATTDERLVTGGRTIVDQAISVISKAEVTESFFTPWANSTTEQLFMTHEIAHAVGLVDSGLSMVHDHSAPGGHCSVAGCLMAADLSLPEIRYRLVREPSAILFDDDCLEDVDHAQ